MQYIVACQKGIVSFNTSSSILQSKESKEFSESLQHLFCMSNLELSSNDFRKEKSAGDSLSLSNSLVLL